MNQYCLTENDFADTDRIVANYRPSFFDVIYLCRWGKGNISSNDDITRSICWSHYRDSLGISFELIRGERPFAENKFIRPRSYHWGYGLIFAQVINTHSAVKMPYSCTVIHLFT